jgi:hypothetical protein
MTARRQKFKAAVAVAVESDVSLATAAAYTL